MVIDILSSFKGITPFKGITLDDGWDQINRSFMFVLCVVMGTVVTVRQYAGAIIACNGFTKYSASFSEDYCWTQGLYTIREAYDVDSRNYKLPYPGIISCDGFTKYSGSFSEDYCWTQGLYTIKEAYDQLAQHVPYPGVIPEEIPPCIERELINGGQISCPDPENVKPPTRVYHLWYQWVPFYFWLAAAAFFFPYLIYKHFGVGDLKPLINMLHNPVVDEGDQMAMAEKASTWLYYKLNVYMNENTPFAILTEKHRLFFIVMSVKVLYLVISILALFLTDEMFEIGSFVRYGSEWATTLPAMDNETTLVKDKLFPKMVACEIKRWGPSGIEEEQGMCVLAPNVINQYLFLILWFAIIFTITCNFLSVLFALTKLIFVLGSYKRLLASAFLKDELQFKQIFMGCGTSGRAILMLIASNIRPQMFEIVKTQLVQKFSLHDNRRTRDYKHMFFNVGTSGRVLLEIVASNISPRTFEYIMASLSGKLIQERLKGNGKSV